MAACAADTDAAVPALRHMARLCPCTAVAGMLRAAAPNPRHPPPQGLAADDADATRPARTAVFGTGIITDAVRKGSSPCCNDPLPLS